MHLMFRAMTDTGFLSKMPLSKISKAEEAHSLRLNSELNAENSLIKTLKVRNPNSNV